MRCTSCQSNQSKTINTREIKNSQVIKRRRECTNCKKRFTTYEQPLLKTGRKYKNTTL